MKLPNRGFLIYAAGKDYTKQAYLCALSIRASGNKYPVSIVTSDKLPNKYKKVFDNVIDIPWYAETDSRFQTEHRWKLYHATPYEETIVLDSDVLVQQDLESFWSLMINYNLYYPSRVFTYRKELITNNHYRKAFVANRLPSVYNTLHYFKKNDFCKEYYTWVELICNNWELFYGNFCKEYYPKMPSMDITCAIAAKIMDIDTQFTNSKLDLPMIVHMKPAIQNWWHQTSSWQDRVGTYVTDDATVKVGNHLQDTIFHYTENNFVTDDLIRKYEQCQK
jgi:hypothetical protein